jgi:hypothetical protein
VNELKPCPFCGNAHPENRRTPGPGTKAVIAKIQEEIQWQSGDHRFEDEDEGSIWFTAAQMKAFLAEWELPP